MSKVKKIIITGANGLLGASLVKQLSKSSIQFLPTSKSDRSYDKDIDHLYESADILDYEAFKKIIERFQPTHIIHTAAITNVDYCELNEEKCMSVNYKATKELFQLCIKHNIHFQFLSTDFVFDGEKGNYSENDHRNPLSIYAKSKYLAENILLESNYSNWSIVRTIIVYGPHLNRSNVIRWAKESLKKGIHMKVIDDQFRAPTWADDLAWACLRICELNKKGIFHISGPETFSILNIVKKVAHYYGYSMNNVERVDSQTLNQPAKRPPRTGFNLTKAKSELGYNPKTLEETFEFV